MFALFWKKIRARRDFFIYLYRVDKKHRNGIHKAALGFLLAVLGTWLTFKGQLDLSLSAIVGYLLTLLSLIGSFWAIIKTYEHIKSFDAPNKGEEYVMEVLSELPVLQGQSTTLAALPPREEGFQAVVPPGSQEIAHTSSALNDWLSSQPLLQISRKHGNKNCFSKRLSQDQDLSKRLIYLRHLVIKNAVHNETKYRLNRINIGNRDIEVERVDYYDAMLTNQLVTTRVHLGLQGTRQRKRDVVFDYRKHFPLIKTTDSAGNLVARLAPLDDDHTPLLANSVGVTTFALTRDKYPVIFYQKSENIEGADLFTLGGSGSGDWNDLQSPDFLTALKKGMIRELLEEGRVPLKGRALEALREKTIANTLITGYFRWLRRGGKPEFLGVTRLDVSRAEITADTREVSYLLEDEPLAMLQLDRMDDFIDLQKTFTATFQPPKSLRMSLSSAMAIWRLAEIARTTTTPADIALRQSVADLLGLKAT